MEFIKKDINGEVVIAKITTKNYMSFSVVEVNLIKKKLVKRFILKPIIKDVIVFNTSMDLVFADDWNCENFENWADICVEKYNEKIIKKEKEDKTRELIKNGCK